METTTNELILAEIIKLNNKIDGHDLKFTSIEERFNNTEKRFDGIYRRFDGIDQRLDKVEVRLHGIDQRLGNSEQEMKKGFEELSAAITFVGNKVFDNHERRIFSLEQK